MQVVNNLHNWRADLSRLALADLNDLTTKRTLVDGESLYASGERADCGYQIISGKIKVCNYTSGGDEIIMSYLYSGDCLGDMGLANGGLRVNYAVASQKTEINILSRAHYACVCKKHPEILVAMNKVLSNRLQLMFVMVEDAHLLPLYERLARVLIRLAISNAQRVESSYIITDLSHEILGQMTGAARQSVSREIGRMKAEGLIEIEYNKIIICNLDEMTDKFGYLISHETIIANYQQP